jgi:hypothetical protein
MADNKRSFYRLSFEHPLCSDLKIVGAYGKEMESKKTRVVVKDISAGGLRFSTRLNLPPEANMVLEFRFTLLDKEVRTIGVIQRKWEPDDTHMIDYGVKFTIFENDEIALSGMINNLAVRLKRSPMLSSCSFCTEEDLEFVRGGISARESGSEAVIGKGSPV